MLNKIWFGLLLIGLLYGFGRSAINSWRGPVPNGAVVVADDKPVEKGARNLEQMGKDLNAAALDAAEVSVELCIGLIGIMALWLGLLQIARDAGMVDALARLLSPLMRWLFPEIPDGHPAQGAMLMNMSANILGLDNAATPLGIKAMQELQTLNPDKETATDSMAMFMAINTSSVTLIPFTIIAYRRLAGSENPTEPLVGIVLVTTVSTIVAIFAAKMLAKSHRYRLPATQSASNTADSNTADSNTEGQS